MNDDILTNALKAKLLSRRAVMRTGLAALGATALGALPSRLARAAGGTLTWAKPLEATSLDPHTSILGSSWQLLHLVYDSLVDVDGELNPIPGIAESWEQESPTSYVFTLREGVRFSDGEPVTVEDAVGSLQRMIDPATGSWWGLPLGPVTKIAALDERRLRVSLSRPHEPFIAAMAPTMTSILPMKKLRDGSFDPTKDLLGSGPYHVVSHVQDDSWVLERNPYYWKEGVPLIERLVIRIVPNDNARIAMLRDGTVEIASFEASPDAPLLLSAVPNVEVRIEDVTNFYILALNAVREGSPFKSLELRQAVALALDREQIRDIALGGAGDPTAVMAPGFNACDLDALPLFKRDVERAKTLVEQAGAAGLSFELLVRNIAADIQMAQVIQQNVAEIGLTANIAVIDEGIWVRRAWVDNPSDFEATIGWYAGYADPALVTLWWDPEIAGFTAGHVTKDEALNALIQQGLTTAGDERKAVLQQLCNHIDETANVIPLVTRRDTIAYRTDRLEADLNYVEGYVHTLRGIETYKLVGG